jgi:hypothetical protein
MQKILFATDGLRLDEQSVKFACYMAHLTNSKLTGVFLENLIENQRFVVKPAYGTIFADWEINESSPAVITKLETINKNIALFREICEQNAVLPDLRLDPGVPLHELIAETRFADLLIVSPLTSFDHDDNEVPTDFIKSVLKETECPVVVVPLEFEGIDELVFAYDGSRASAFAIRQFTYLFPLLNNKPVTVLQVNKKGEWDKDEKASIGEWLANHYINVKFECLRGVPDEEILGYLYNRPRAMVVMGAFGRSATSMFFRQSKAESVLQLIAPPLFISHH